MVIELSTDVENPVCNLAIINKLVGVILLNCLPSSRDRSPFLGLPSSFSFVRQTRRLFGWRHGGVGPASEFKAALVRGVLRWVSGITTQMSALSTKSCC